MRRFILFAMLVAALAFAAGASAAGPTITDEHIGPFDAGVYESCSAGFDVLQKNLVIDRRRIDFYDESDNLVREIRQVYFTADLVNSVSGYTLTYYAHFTRVWDVPTDTVTLTGLLRKIQIPGEGTVDLAAGREVIDANDNVTFVAGQTRVDFDQQLCELLNH